MSFDIKIEFNEDNSFWNIIPKGEIDIYTAPRLKEELVKALEKKKASLSMDLKDLDYIDSTGLGTLISVFKVVKENDNKIYMKNVKPNIRKLLDITDLDKVFVIEE